MLNIDTYRDLKKKIIINERGEELVFLDEFFSRFLPHPYLEVGAPYAEKSPFFVRKEVLKRLYVAQSKLESLNKGFKLKVFDAYRPLAVQKYMIEYDTKRYGKKITQKFWSPISTDVKLSPPPHSTGGALDLTIIDKNGLELDMGTKIDEFTESSYSNFNAISSTCRDNRALLLEVMTFAGFSQLPTEWWHFSFGDQIWAIDNNTYAKYGLI